MDKSFDKFRSLFENNNAILGYTSVEISPVFKLIVFEGTVEGILVYDFEGNRIPFEHVNNSFVHLRLEYPNIWGIVSIKDDKGYNEESIKLEYKDGKLLCTF